MSASIKIQRPTLFVGLRTLNRADVPREVSAGITQAALMIPLNIGYVQVVGLSPAVGLYAAIIPLVVFALLTSSRHLVTSPDASMATLVGATLVAFAAPGDAQAMVDVDTSGAGALRQAITLLKKRNVTFAVSRADRAFRSWLEQYHLTELIDPEKFYPTNRHAAEAFCQSPEGVATEADSSTVDEVQ